MLTVCTSSTSPDYTTLQRLKEELNITDTKDHELLERLITGASQWAEQYTGRTFGLEIYQETVGGFGRRNLMLSRYPIRSVLRLFNTTSTETATELLSSEYRVQDAEAGFLSRDQGWKWNVAGASGPSGFGPGLNPLDPDPSFGEQEPWLVEYSAGYVGPLGKNSTEDGTTSTAQSLPRTIEQAVIFKAREWFLQSKRDPSVLSRKVGDLAVTYRSDGKGPAEMLLDSYRRF